MTYNDYLIKITSTMQIRSTDFRLSQNDIIVLANNIYNEIATEVVLEFLQQQVTIDSTVDTYDLNALYVQVGNEIPLDTMVIKDDEGKDVTSYFRDLGDNVFQVNRFVWSEKNLAFLRDQDGRDITFVRQVIPDIESLTVKQQNLLFNPIIEGMMWYVHDAIPNPTSSNAPAEETDRHYGRYQAAKNILRNQLPQRI